jgi:hypothetical protein
MAIGRRKSEVFRKNPATTSLPPLRNPHEIPCDLTCAFVVRYWLEIVTKATGEEAKESCRKLHNKELHNSYVILRRFRKIGKNGY